MFHGEFVGVFPVLSAGRLSSRRTLSRLGDRQDDRTGCAFSEISLCTYANSCL